MKYLRSWSVVQILGELWQPGRTGATSRTVSEREMAKLRTVNGGVTRESVLGWIKATVGDFASITDFSANLEVDGETLEIPWASEENENTYHDCIDGEVADPVARVFAERAPKVTT